jgi:amino acid adenylation domain-containing protein/FkbH-like protein
MVGHFETLLAAVAEHPEQRLSLLPILSPGEANQVLSEWNATEKEYPDTVTLAQLFEAQVARTPDAVALIAGTDRLSYRELNARANQVAHELRSLGVGPGTMVGICLERSWRLLVAILGVLKAGGAYVPLDPAYPKDRLAFILEDAKAPVLLTQESLRGQPVRNGTKILCLDSDWEKIRNHSRENISSKAQSSDLAYIIYTSGSTGKPKGVAIENRNAVALVAWAKDVFTTEELAGVLASTSICFDLSVFEFFVTLSYGGMVILADNALALPGLPAANEVTLINTVPSAIRELLRIKGVPASVRVVNLAGEPLVTPLVDRIYGETPVKKVYDLYGPSETTTYSTFTLREAGKPATIGKPLSNEQVYLLDANRQPVPIGVPGELYIGGAGVARGYLNRPELTAEKFVENPFTKNNSRPNRLYKTGDLARWRADGNIEFLGRIDHQVKIRGFRIELGEVESAFRKNSAVREAVVMARETQSGDKRLVAYIVNHVGKQTSVEELRRFGKQVLPEYMVPSAFIMLDEMPLTPNGKINRKALPEPEQDRRDTTENFVAPQNPVEEQFAAIWREVLGLERIGIRDNFFELGGHSLLAIQVISRVREVFKVELPLFSLFDAPTIELLAKGLASGEWTKNQLPVLPLIPIPREGTLPVSFVQERLWFLDQLEPGDHAYNVPVALRIQGPLNFAALQNAFNELVRRQEALRTTFAYVDGNLIQKIAPPQPVEIKSAKFESSEKIQNWINTEAQRPFDLSNGPLLRVQLAEVSKMEHVLLVVMHHTVSDGWSLTILFQELETFYNAFAGGKSAPALPELPVQYADFAAWKRQCLQGIAMEQELNFWKEKLTGAPGTLELPVDRPEPDKSTRRADRQTLRLPQNMAEAITAFSNRENSTPFAVLMTALAITLEKWAHQRDIVIGTVVAGRNRREMENVIGCFMNFLPIRTKIVGDETGQEILAKVKTMVLEAQAHQDCPFEKIVEVVNPERRKNKNPLYNVALLLQNFPAQMFKGKDLQTTQIPVDLHAALLDLRFEAELNAHGLSVGCEYKTDLFDAGTIEQFLSSFNQILETFVQNPRTRLSEFKINAGLETQARAARRKKTEETIVVAATFTAEPVEDSLRYWIRELEMSAQVAFAPFNQIFQELLDPTSLTATNVRGLNVLLLRLEDWLDSSEEPKQISAIANTEQIERNSREFVSVLKSAVSRTSAPFLVVICPPSTIALADAQQKNLLERAEKSLVVDLESVNGVYTVTTRELNELYPVADYYDASGDELGAIPYLPVYFTALGTMIARKFHALKHSPAKVIVLDCDNTLWRGVCGEEGAKGICLEAPWKALQEFMRTQHEAGRLLAVCSKNNEEDVREVFAQRLDMPLRHEDFAAWRTNWNPKSENIKSLATELKLGLDSFIFVDDNPVECAEVEANCPEVLTLLLPENPEQIPQFLKHCWAFDVLKVTAEDKRRGEMYRENRQREELMSQAMSLGDFIAGLELQIDIEPMTAEQLPRVSQLTQRTNQFNCTTIRRSETEIRGLADAKQIFTVSVKDRFGDYGLVGAMICEAGGESLDVDTFLLSCRVLGRGVEHEMLGWLGKIAQEKKLHWVDVHFNPSSKNKPAHDFLQSIGKDFQQPQNGGFIYRFPTEFAKEVTFNPSEEKVKGRKSEVESQSALASNSSRPFSHCRTIAVEANDAAAIHRAIESGTAVRAAKNSDYVAPTTELEQQLCGLWEKLLHVERVGVSDNFFELGGHSLLAVRMFAEVEKIAGHKLPLVTIFQAPTIAALARTLTKSRLSESNSPLVPVQPNGSRPPLFLVHGAGGDVLWGYANLAKHLTPDQPIYGIKSRGRMGLEEFETIEEMAHYYREEIQKFQPHGPYHLGGYCFGGNVAYEMARQLRARGEEVALLLLIDATPSNAGYENIPWWNPKYPFRFARNFSYWLSDFSGLPRRERIRFFARKSRAIGRKLIGKFQKQNGSMNVDLEDVIDPNHFPENELKFWQIHLRALITHVDKPYDGVITLLRTRGQQLLCSLENDFCWSKLAKGVQVKLIPGSHENIFMEPHVKSLAEELEGCLSGPGNRSLNQKKNSHEPV